MARVSGHVKSHTKHLLCDHGTSVKPSGRWPSFRDRHDGSSLAGISAAVSARVMRSLTALCREWRPADRRHDRPWTPYWSTFSSQTHWWGAQIGAPRHSAVPMRDDEFSRRVPTDEHGIAFKNLQNEVMTAASVTWRRREGNSCDIKSADAVTDAIV